MNRGGWGEGTLTALGNGKWKLRLPPYLGRGQRTFRADTKTAARKEQRRLLDEAYEVKFATKQVQRFFGEFCDQVLDQHIADPHSTQTLRQSLKSARAAFGEFALEQVTYDVITNWRAREAKRLAPKTLHGYTAAVKQVLNAAVKSGVLAESPARHVSNPLPAVGIVNPFSTLDEVLAVAEELPAMFRALPVFACMTGLRPEEWLAVERGDLRDGAVFVNKRFTRGQFKTATKNGDLERMVPLPPLAAEWLERQPRRLDTRLLFPGSTGRHLVLNDFREKVWKPAFVASGVTERRLKDMRHTYASWQLTGDCNVWHLSKVMGTAVQQIERTYGRWIPGSEAMVLGAMGRFVERQTATK